MTTTTFGLTSWNFAVYGDNGILFRNGHGLSTPLVRAEVERLVHAAALLNQLGGVALIQENWCPRYADQLVGLRNPAVDHAFSSFGHGITAIGDAIDLRLTPLSVGAARLLRARAHQLVEPLRENLPRFALSLDAVSGRLAAMLEPLTPGLTRWIEQQTGSIVNTVGGEDVGAAPSRLERFAYEVFLDRLIALAVRELLRPESIFGGGLTAMWPQEYTPKHRPPPVFHRHPITSGTETLAEKGFLEFEIDVEGTPITVLTVHTHAISESTCKLQILNLIEYLRTLVQQGKRVVIAGDFNIAAERINTYTGKLQPTDAFEWLTARMRDIGMIEAHDSLPNPIPPSPTYDPTTPILPEPHRRRPHAAATPEAQAARRQRLDFAFVGPGLRVQSLRVLEEECLVQVPNDGTYSTADHFPLHLEIEIVPFHSTT